MDVGTELFAMAATCAYARSLASQEHPQGDPLQLADLFCVQARRRIEQHFRAIRWGNQRSANALAAQVLSGEFQWMEQGVISPQQPDPSLKFVASSAQYEHDGLNTFAERS